MNSINTNFGASIALQSLNKTNRALDAVQKRVSTGYAVADAKDDGAAFAVAQGLRAQIKGNEGVLERIAMGKGLLSVSMESLQAIIGTTDDMRKVLVKLADQNLSPAERTHYNADYAALKANIPRVVSQSFFNGRSMVNSVSITRVVTSNTGGNYRIDPTNVPALFAGLSAAPSANATDAATLIAGGGLLDTFAADLRSGLAMFSYDYRALSNQEKLINDMSDALTMGLGAIVDADLAKDSAKLQSLQIRQQLGTQALSLANQKPSSLLDLFR